MPRIPVLVSQYDCPLKCAEGKHVAVAKLAGWPVVRCPKLKTSTALTMPDPSITVLVTGVGA